jgi:hypothetical protein
MIYEIEARGWQIIGGNIYKVEPIIVYKTRFKILAKIRYYIENISSCFIPGYIIVYKIK